MSSWATGDKRTLLHFSESTLEIFYQHVQASDTDCEAGGLLLGSVHGAHMLIEQATVPTVWDKRFHYLFERMNHTGFLGITVQAKILSLPPIWVKSKGDNYLCQRGGSRIESQ